jgi:prepilin-type N-terminal cleavage/methylation domain-containing protein
MQRFRNGFTMIELIFVIVILGILAAVAIPKLAATRDDAKIAADVSSAAQALQNLASEYTAKGAFVNYGVTDANKAVNCFVFTLNNAVDGNISLGLIGNSSSACSSIILSGVQEVAKQNNLINQDGTAKTYIFATNSIVE